MKTYRAGIVGGTGYVGRELMRYLLAHPQIELAAVTSREHCGKPVGEIHGGLSGVTPLVFSEANASLADLDIVFTALPHLESAPVVAMLRETRADLPIVDLGADFRLSAASFQKFYGSAHRHPELLEEVIYGTPELDRDRIAGARLIANPGCFAHCIILALAPLAKIRAIDGPVFVSAITGSSGSGAQATARTHHPERNDSVSGYSVLAHRHVPEIECALEVSVRLVPLSGPYTRGIFAIVFAKIKNAKLDVRQTYEAFAAANPFIRLRTDSPRLFDVRGTNFCDLAIHQNGNEVVILSAIDNLGKGAAGNAVQCANMMMGLPESAGLIMPSLAP